MPENKKPFKKAPKRFHPRGLSVLYEDRDLLVVDKAAGLLTVSSETVRDRTAYFLLNEYVRKGNSKARHQVFVVHRLDRETSGVLVFAKHDPAKRFLQDEWQGFQKTYCAIVRGSPREKKGLITSYLTENRAHRMYSVTDSRKGKLAKTRYRVVRESPTHSLLDIDLLTGRKNQIRVHLADKGHPVAGDKKYGKKEAGIKRLMLHAVSITLLHPHSKETMTLTAPVPAYFESVMKGS